jgi:protein-S-isoprenylcysteine O-methyltransferase Ste14
MARFPLIVYVVMYAGLFVWLLPFFLAGWSRRPPVRRDPRWRWGILLEVAGYMVMILYALHLGAATVSPWRIAFAILFFAIASLLSWTSARTLGRFLRFEAALDDDHQLIRRGPYGVVRHPIYASMLCMFLGMAALLATPGSFIVALALFVTGTEIRVRIEDKLLAEKFGAEFAEYRRTTPAYVPLLR